MGILTTITDAILGRRIDNTGTRHRPRWLPKHFDHRWLDGRFAVMDLPPYKPPYRRHARYKAWVCMGPRYIFTLNAIVEVDLDERTLDVNVYR